MLEEEADEEETTVVPNVLFVPSAANIIIIIIILSSSCLLFFTPNARRVCLRVWEKLKDMTRRDDESDETLFLLKKKEVVQNAFSHENES